MKFTVNANIVAVAVGKQRGTKRTDVKKARRGGGKASAHPARLAAPENIERVCYRHSCL